MENCSTVFVRIQFWFLFPTFHLSIFVFPIIVIHFVQLLFKQQINNQYERERGESGRDEDEEKKRWIRKESQNDRKRVALPRIYICIYYFFAIPISYTHSTYIHTYVYIHLFWAFHNVTQRIPSAVEIFLSCHLSVFRKQRCHQVDLIDMKIRVKLSSRFYTWWHIVKEQQHQHQHQHQHKLSNFEWSIVNFRYGLAYLC